MAEERVLQVTIQARDEASEEIKKVGKVASSVGDQLKNSFSKAALVSGAAIGALTAEAWRSIAAFDESERTISQLEAVLKSTSGVAGITKEAAIDLAASMQQFTTYSDEAILNAENLLLTFTNIGKDTFPEATQVVLDMSTALGQDLKSSAIQLGKALQDPILGVTALRRVGVNFSEAQQDVIKGLVESGKLLDAQKLILKELQTEFGGSAKAAGETFGGQLAILKNNVNDLEEAFGGFLAKALKPVVGAMSEFSYDLSGVISGTVKLSEFASFLGEKYGVLGAALGQVINFFATHRAALLALGGAIAGFLALGVGAAIVAMFAFLKITGLAIGIATGFGATLALIKPALDNYAAGISSAAGFLSNLLTSAQAFISSIGPAFSTLVTTLGPIISAIASHIANSFTGAFSLIIFTFQSVFVQLQLFFANLLAYLQIQFTIISTIWTTVWGALLPILQSNLSQYVWFIGAAFDSIKLIISTALESIGFLWDTSWKEKYEKLVEWLTKMDESVAEFKKNILDKFWKLAEGITNALRSIKFPHLKVGEGMITVAGREVKYPKLDVEWYQQGGFVPKDVLAFLHAGEFVMSRDMLAGRAPVPAPITNYNSPISLGPVYVRSESDIDTLAQRLDFYMRTSGRL